MAIATPLVRRTGIAVLFLAALAILLIAPGAISAETEAEEAVWSADMLVVQYTEASIGAASADLFSNIGGSRDPKIKSLWSHVPSRDIRLAFQEGLSDADDLTLIVGELTLEFPLGSSGNSSFKWTDVDVDWEDGETLQVRIVQTSALEEPEEQDETTDNTPATGEPTISGTAQVDETLTADTSNIADDDGLDGVSFTYQWVRSDDGADTDIAGETDSTYTLVLADQGKTIKVKVTFTDDADNQESLTSEATVAVAATVPTEPLSLTVTPGDQIQELDASWQAPSSNGGSDVTGYKVQWKEAAHSWDTAADVSEATVTGTSLTITSLTGGVEYTVRVIASNAAGDGPASAEAKGTPAGGVSEQQAIEPANSAPTGLPTISGTPQVEQTLTADTSDIDDDDGLTNVSYEYQWLAGGLEISGATGSSYQLTASERGKTVQVRVTFTDDADNQETLTSEPTVPVAAKPNNEATGAPTILGTVQASETLTVETSKISDADGIDNAIFEYQWISNDGTTDTDITGGTNSTYIIKPWALGKYLKVRVRFTDDAGNAEALTSIATTAVEASPNQIPTGTVYLWGMAEVGQELTTSTGSIYDPERLAVRQVQLPVDPQRRNNGRRYPGRNQPRLRAHGC